MSTWSGALHQLADAPTPQGRSEAIDHLTELLQKAEWRLPDAIGERVISGLRDRLSDSNW